MTEIPEQSRSSRRTFLAASVAAGGVSFAAVPGVAGADRGHDHDDRPPLAQKPSKELERILREVDQRRIEATVRKLVSFGTRHTLSVQDDPARGIGAARDWMFAEMSKYAADSGGRMTVELQSYIQEPDGSRIPVPTKITNVVATLRGSVTPNRVYVITGHYDSRVTDVLNATSDAPGANDDASGVAVVMEAARVLAKHGSAATLVFAPVAGEEQGLYGSAHLAQVLKAAGADVQGMFTNDIVGSSTADDGTRDPRTIRLFTEGVPTEETPAEGNIRRAVGGENDSPARQLGRFVRDVADNDATGMNVRVIYRRDRYLRGGDHISFLDAGLPGGPVHRAERELRPPAPGRPGGERRAVRRPDRVLRLRVHVQGVQGQRGDPVVARERAGHAEERPHPHRGAHQQHRPRAGTGDPSPTSPATRWCGGRRPLRSGHTPSGSAT